MAKCWVHPNHWSLTAPYAKDQRVGRHRLNRAADSTSTRPRLPRLPCEPSSRCGPSCAPSQSSNRWQTTETGTRGDKQAQRDHQLASIQSTLGLSGHRSHRWWKKNGAVFTSYSGKPRWDKRTQMCVQGRPYATSSRQLHLHCCACFFSSRSSGWSAAALLLY